MLYSWLADGVLIVHFAFVLFVAFGGLLLLRWRRVAWFHVPAVIWGAITEFAGIVCPLTPLENILRARAGQVGYTGGFIEHYITRVMYPNGLTRGVQVALGSLAVLTNVALYWWALTRRSHFQR
jgi:uncharacterized protein DUF2784